MTRNAWKNRLQGNCRVDSNGCWNWLGRTNTGGYAIIWDEGKTFFVARAAWEVWKGPIPENEVVCRSCENKLCFNPDHLALKDSAEFLKSQCRKGALNPALFYRDGEENPNAKLTPKQVRTIRKMYQLGARQKSIAEMFQISPNTVWAIVHRKSWIHLTDFEVKTTDPVVQSAPTLAYDLVDGSRP